MNTTVECQVLFHQFVDFISQNKNVSIREIKAATPTNDIDSKVRQLEISHESDSSISIRAPGKKAIPYDCRHLGFRDSETKAWKYFMDIVSGNTHSFNWGPAYEHKENSRVRLKIKNYDAQWKLCDEICKRLKCFLKGNLDGASQKDTSFMSILPWVLTGNEDSSSGSTIQKRPASISRQRIVYPRWKK